MEGSRLVDALGFAIDESNHGKDDEVFVMLCSDRASDFKPYKTTKKKRVKEVYKTTKRKSTTEPFSEKSLLANLEMRDFRYLYVDREDYETYGQLNLFVEVARRLAAQFIYQREGKKTLAMYVDGTLQPSQIKKLVAGVASDYHFSKRRVGILPMPKKKRKKGKPLPHYKIVPLLSLADTASNYIMHKGPRGRRLGSIFNDKRIEFK
jgi:hypothetical protein